MLLLHLALSLHYRPLVVPLYRHLALGLDSAAWLLLLLGSVGAPLG